MRVVTRAQYHAWADVAIHDLGGIAQPGTSAGGGITVRTIMDPVTGLPWLTRRTSCVSGHSVYFVHDTAPAALNDTPARDVPPTTRIFRRHDIEYKGGKP